MENKESARNKIILLYIIHRLPGLSVPELTDLAIDTCYMNYFSFASVLDEISRDKLITVAIYKGELCVDSDRKPVKRCDITKEGLSVLQQLSHIVPGNLSGFLSSHEISMDRDHKPRPEVDASYQQNLSGDYSVSLKINEGFREFVSVKISVPTKEIAESICRHWTKNPQSKYLELLDILNK